MYTTSLAGNAQRDGQSANIDMPHTEPYWHISSYIFPLAHTLTMAATSERGVAAIETGAFRDKTRDTCSFHGRNDQGRPP